MKSFLKYLLATVVGMLIVGFIMLFVFLGSVGALLSAGSKPVVQVKDDTVLEICLDKPVSDKSHRLDRSMGFFSVPGLSKTMGLNDMVRAVRHAKDDAKIKGIYLKYDGGTMGWAANTELRQALAEFKESGKFIYAYADSYPQGAYYLASVADSVFLQPQGSVGVKGLGVQLMFFAGLLNKTGVEMQVVRHGQFKSAVEPYLRRDMSAANRLQYEVMLGSIWGRMRSEMAASRHMTAARMDEIADKLSGFIAKGAAASGLVDALVPCSLVEENMLSLRMGLPDSVRVNKVSLRDYAGTLKEESKSTGKVAVVYAEGEIITGKGDAGKIGTDIAADIEKAVKDKNVKALVLRVNSPGGSVLTSDIIYQAVLKAKAKMPVVASFGNYAASGGYYISCPAHKIYSQPTTLTGSIGVFGIIPNFKGLGRKIGVHMDEVGTNENATALQGVFRPMTAYEESVMQQSIEEVYAGFVDKVSKGRGMTFAQVDSIGQGRVWSGVNALEIGLVDELGGLRDAIAEAARMAGMDDYVLVEYPKEKSFSEQVLELFGDMEARSAKSYIGKHFGSTGTAVYEQVSDMMRINEPQVLARMPEVFVME